MRLADALGTTRQLATDRVLIQLAVKLSLCVHVKCRPVESSPTLDELVCEEIGPNMS